MSSWPLKPSPSLRRLWLLAMALVVAAILLCKWLFALKIPLILVMLTVAIYEWRRLGTVNETLDYHPLSKQWWLSDWRRQDPIVILPETFLSTAFIVLALRDSDGRRQNRVIIRDTLTQNAYRHLLMTLKIHGLNQTMR